MSLGNILSSGGVPFPSRSTQDRALQYKRRAYGSIKSVGNDQFTCSGGKTISFQNLSSPTTKRGGRYAPAPHLTSITTKNAGGNDISEAALWEIEFQWTAYSKGDLDAYATSFMIPGGLINANFGWNTGGGVSISGARIYDFSWSYNIDDGSYSCTGKAIGQVAGAFAGATIQTDPEGATVDDGSGETKNYSLFAKLQTECEKAFNVKRNTDGKLTANAPVTDGKAIQNGNYALISLFMESGVFSDTSQYQTLVRMSLVIDFINKNVGGGYSYKFASDKYHPIDIRSADPARMLFSGQQAQYSTSTAENKNNYSNLTGSPGVISQLWISTEMLLEIERSLLDKQSDKDPGSYTAGAFLSKLFGEISNLSGGLIDCILVPGDDKEMLITNKMFDIKKSGGTVISARGLTSPVKSLSMSSAMDPDMAAIAFSANSGKYPSGMAKNLFAGCQPKDPPPAVDYIGRVGEKANSIGNAYDPNQVTDFKKILREYVMSSLSGKGISIRYTIDLNLTCDGFAGVQFGQTFKVTEIPNSIGDASKVSFMVGEIEHKCDGATWETGITGYMMVDA